MITLEQAVAIEAKILDVHIPEWWEKIDTLRLDQQYSNTCIGGQLKWPDVINHSERITSTYAYCTWSIDKNVVYSCKLLWLKEIENRSGDVLV